MNPKDQQFAERLIAECRRNTAIQRRRAELLLDGGFSGTAMEANQRCARQHDQERDASPKVDLKLVMPALEEQWAMPVYRGVAP